MTSHDSLGAIWTLLLLRLRRRSSVGYAIVAVYDTLRVSWRLWRVLRKLDRPDLVLVQNPPEFPTLVVCWFSLRRRGVRFILDWHNVAPASLQQFDRARIATVVSM